MSDDGIPFRKWLTRHGITIEHLWLAAPFFVLFIKAFRVPLPLLDFWWHLKMGEIIVFTHSIPRTDLFSFTAAGQPFIVQNWLAEIFYYWACKAGDFPLLIFLNTLLLAVALFLVFLLCRESTPRIRLAAFISLLACLALPCNARPQVFSFVLFAFFYWVLDGYRFRRRNRLWLLPVATVVWVNLHGAFVVGLALIAVILLSETARRLWERADEEALSFRQLRNLAFAFAACAAATLANPETYRVYGYIHLVLSDQASQRLVMEWQPPRIDTILGIEMFFGLFGLAILGLIYSRRRPKITDLALFLCFSIFALTALRNTAWFAIVIAPILARYWTGVDVLEPLRSLRRFPFVNSTVRFMEGVPSHPNGHGKVNLALAVLALIIVVFTSPWIRSRLDPGCLLDPQTPVAAVDYIDAHNLRGRIFHPQIFGDYLLWRLYPDHGSFIDGRVHLFGESFVSEYRKIFYDSRWEDKVAAFGIQYLLLSKNTEQTDCSTMIHNARESGRWHIPFENDISILFEQRDSRTVR